MSVFVFFYNTSVFERSQEVEVAQLLPNPTLQRPVCCELGAVIVWDCDRGRLALASRDISTWQQTACLAFIRQALSLVRTASYNPRRKHGED